MKKVNWIIVLHVVLMLLIAVNTVIGIVKLFSSAAVAELREAKVPAIANAVLLMVVVAMLVVDTLYLLKHYKKKAAIFYKALFLTHVVECVLSVVIALFSPITAFTLAFCVMNGLKAACLLALTFVKDLGEKKTWTIFFIVFALDFAQLFLALVNLASLSLAHVFDGITSLVADGSIGLAIHGKHSDKAARGAE